MRLLFYQAPSPPPSHVNSMVILQLQIITLLFQRRRQAQRSQVTCTRSHSLSWDLKRHHLLLLLLVGSWPR